jgi:Flp pilus assembly protein TadD
VLFRSPTPPAEDAKVPDSAFALEREKLLNKFGSDADVLGTADAFHRQGLNLYAIGIIKGALAKRPKSPDLWVGLGNALVIHGQGVMSPAAQLAFERAAALAPDHPGPPFFLGLAYAQAGQFDRAEQTWRALLDRSPADAPYRAELEQRLNEIAAMRGGAR